MKRWPALVKVGSKFKHFKYANKEDIPHPPTAQYLQDESLGFVSNLL